jgi:beta-lactam-binding protein with PASTA domain
MTTPQNVATVRRQRRALILACAEFTDPAFPALRSPRRDAMALAEVLSDPSGPRYHVSTEINCSAQHARVAIERFFSQARPDDVHLLYFSCHGVQDPHGDLYFAFTDTKSELPGSTAVSADWVRAQIQASRSRTTVVLVDCCFSGAFLRGMTRRSGGDANVEALVRNLPDGNGVAVLTASGENEFSLEDADDRVAAAVKPSYFTEAIVTGIGTGAADRNGNGRITVDDLYDYVYQRIVSGPSPQRPRKILHGEGQVVVAEVGPKRPEPPLPPAPPQMSATSVLRPEQMLTPWPPLPAISLPRPAMPVARTARDSAVPTSETRIVAVAKVTRPPSPSFVPRQHDPTTTHPIRGRRAKIVAAAAMATVALIVGVLWLTHTPAPPKVAPSLIGLTSADANSAIRAAGLTASVGPTQLNTACEPGTVTQQQPGSGQRMSAGDLVTITVCGTAAPSPSKSPSKSPPPVLRVTIPHLPETSINDAEDSLTARGLRFRIVLVDSAQPKDQVLKSNPTSGTAVRKGTIVTLTVSRGNLLRMPDVRSMKKDVAISTLSGRGFNTPRIVAVQALARPFVGSVADQNPSPGEEVPADTPITLWIFTDTSLPVPTSQPVCC